VSSPNPKKHKVKSRCADMWMLKDFVASVSEKSNFRISAGVTAIAQKCRLLHFSYIVHKQQTMSRHGILVFLEGISHIICTASLATSPWDLAEIEQNDLVNRVFL
jgi:hypothetical protein